MLIYKECKERTKGVTRDGSFACELSRHLKLVDSMCRDLLSRYLKWYE